MINRTQFFTLLPILLIACSASYAEELIVNGDFTQGLVLWPQSGSYTNADDTVVVESGVSNEDGNPYLFINFAESLSGAKGRFQRVDQSILPGSRLMVSTDFRTEGLTCFNDINATVGAQVRIQGWGLPASENCADININSPEKQWWPVVRTAAESWTTVSTDRAMSLGPDIGCLVVRPLVLSCAGEAQFDNISVNVLPPETLSTGSLPTGDLGLPQYPKSVTDAGTRSLVGSSVFLELRGADPAAVDLLNATISALDINVVTKKKDIAPETFVVRLADITKGMKEYSDIFESGTTLPAGDSRRDQAYVLEIADNGQGTVVTIAGVGGAGQYYGVQTLAALLAQNGEMIWNGTIIDWPAYRYRGLIIGTPSKLDLADKTKRNLLMLVGAEGWVEEDEVPALESYLAECNARHVTCVFGDSPVARVYSPSTPIKFNYSLNEQDVKDRFKRLHDSGARLFYLNFDDINTSRHGGQGALYYAEDIDRYETIANAHYQYSLMVANMLVQLDAQAGGRSTLLFTPMYYYGASDEYGVEGNAYLALISQLPDNVKMVSTAAFSAQRYSQVSHDYARNPAIWDNYIDRYTGYQDYHIPPAHLAAMSGLEHVVDYYLMPMGQPSSPWYCMASHVLSDFLWNGDAYDPELSVLRALPPTCPY